MRDQLGTAKNANEMFRIFSRFNALFVRPRIRGAIREYQKLLIGLVKEDIESLHDKFKVQYPQSKASKMSKVRDLPPLSGSIIWAKEVIIKYVICGSYRAGCFDRNLRSCYTLLTDLWIFFLDWTTIESISETSRRCSRKRLGKPYWRTRPESWRRQFQTKT